MQPEFVKLFLHNVRKFLHYVRITLPSLKLLNYDNEIITPK